jgi:hypothetical protein
LREAIVIWEWQTRHEVLLLHRRQNMSCGRVNDGNYVQINDSHTLLLLVGLFLSLKESVWWSEPTKAIMKRNTVKTMGITEKGEVDRLSYSYTYSNNTACSWMEKNSDTRTNNRGKARFWMLLQHPSTCACCYLLAGYCSIRGRPTNERTSFLTYNGYSQFVLMRTNKLFQTQSM